MTRKAIYILLGLFLLAGVVSASYENAAQISVTDVRMDPEVFMKGDTGTITVQILNSGTESVSVSRATLIDSDITLVSEGTYDSVGDVGAGNSMIFTFTIKADLPDGFYYPKFYLDFRDAGSLRYRIPVIVESTPLKVSVLNRPDTFTTGKKETITLLIGNPRPNTLNGVSVTPLGNGFSSVQTGYFIGALAPDESMEVSFDVTPEEASDLIFQISYRNGINSHTAELTVPLEVKTDKKQAEPLLSNVEVVWEGTYWRVSGDVSNAGLETANSVIVTTGLPATPVDPYRVYVVGALEKDDFSPFEVTFTAANAIEIPLIVQFKDADGNTYERNVSISITQQTVETPQEGWSLAMIALVVLLAIGIGAAIAYSWKRS